MCLYEFIIISQVFYTKLLTKELKTLDKLLVIFEKCAKLHSPRRLVQFWHIFQISLVVLIINCTPSRFKDRRDGATTSVKS
jgi:hypothetical protein